MRMRIVAYLAVVAAIGMSAARADDLVEVKVPFVGCPSDGQEGPQAAPKGTARTISISFKPPGPIAFYQAKGGDGVFAPAGWHCLGLYGSNGDTLVLSAHALPKSGVPSQPFDAPAIQLSRSDGETSGRFTVAKYAWMLFPDLTRDFVKKVEDEGIESKSDIEVAKSPTDQLTYLSPKLVAFETPADTHGIGADGWVKGGTAPITGLVALTDGDDGMGISILRIGMGTKDETWNRVLTMLNTPYLTGNPVCQDSSGDD